jgi:hypothetical protein
MTSELKILPDVSPTALKALANSMLVPQTQSRLEQLLVRNAEGLLSAAEVKELDSIVEQIDELNLLKARAEYTLRYQSQKGSNS